MPAETILSFLKTCTPEAKLGFQVVNQCAPVLKGVKMSNLIIVKQGGWHKIRQHLRGSRVICIVLYADKDKEILFLYRYNSLEKHLKDKQVRSFLKECGYKEFGVADVIQRLRMRYQRYMGAGEEFPHELGVLLEYPVEDVKGFIANKGENCLAVRYWKVYHNLSEAEKKFRIYDEAKNQALTEIMNGYPLRQVAVS